MRRPFRFGVVGGGWRAETFVRMAQRAPEWFACEAVVVRDTAKREEFSRKTGANTIGAIQDLSQHDLDFAVSSVSWSANPGVIRELVAMKLPVLAETPPAPGRAEMHAMMDLAALGSRVQVAEQVALRPLFQAMQAAIQSGLIGEVHSVHVSVSHGYHGVSLLESLLGVAGQSPTITATLAPERSLAGPGRDGGPDREHQVEDRQLSAWLRYPNGRFGAFDFVGTQYFSHIRKSRVLVRGERGEIDYDGARWLATFDSPCSAPFHRLETGRWDDLSPLALQSITLGDHLLYKNPFARCSLQDDEIAMATLMRAVAEGETAYPLTRAMHDHALAIAMGEAAESGQTIAYSPGPWDG
jgi:predicted dehydrogenase